MERERKKTQENSKCRTDKSPFVFTANISDLNATNSARIEHTRRTDL